MGYVAFWAHDVLANMESFIGDFSAEEIGRLEREGVVFVGERADGTREIVGAADVREPVTGSTGTFSPAAAGIEEGGR